MRQTLFLSTFVVGLLLAPGGAALHCNGQITTTETALGTLYLDDRSTAPGEVNHWLYLESNGVAGLQSGFDDPCVEKDGLCEKAAFLLSDGCHHFDPDTKLF